MSTEQKKRDVSTRYVNKGLCSAQADGNLHNLKIEVRQVWLEYVFWSVLTVLTVWFCGKIKRHLLRLADRCRCRRSDH